MNDSDEIARMRAELSGVERIVTRLAQRLDQIEARLGTADDAPTPTSGSVQAPVVPPPLPPVVREKWAPAARQRIDVDPTPAPAAVPTVPPRATAPGAERIVPPVPQSRTPRVKKPRRFGPPEGMSWEMALGTYWAPRIAMLLLAIGTVWGFTFIAHEYQEARWMPYARVGLGLVLAGGLIGIGWRLENKYAAYARLLMGGGLGLLYFVVFATWFIPQTRIAPSLEFTLVLLGLLVLGWGAIAQWRKSQLVALGMTLLGHFTVALSTLSLESPSRAAVGSLLVLGAGGAWFLYRNGWYVVAMSAMIGSYLNQFFWLYRSPADGGTAEFIMGMAVLVAYLGIFAAADRITPAVFAAENPRVRRIYCGLNTGGFVVLGVALIQHFDFARPYDFFLYFATALFAGGMGWSYTQRRTDVFHSTTAMTGPDTAIATDSSASAGDPLSGIYFMKASVLVALGFAAWLDGPTLTLSLALESLVLLLAARKSRRPVGRLLSLGSAVLAFGHGAYTLTQGGIPGYGDAGYWGYGLVTVGTVAVFWAVAEVYRVTPWHTFGTFLYEGLPALEPLCRDLEMLPEVDGAKPRASRMLVSHLLAGFGVLMLGGYLTELLHRDLLPVVLSAVGLTLVAVGLARRSAPLLTGSVFLAGAGSLAWLGWLYGFPPPESHVLLMGAGTVASLLGSSELMRAPGPLRLALYKQHADIQGSWARNTALVSALYAAVAAGLSIATIHEALGAEAAVLVAGVLALLATGFGFAFSAANLGLFGILMTLGSAVPASTLHNGDGPAWMAVAGWLLLGTAALGGERRWWWGECPGLIYHRLLPAPYLLYGLVGWCGFFLAERLFPDAAVPLALAGLAAVLALALPWLHARAMTVVSTTLVAVATLYWLGNEAGDLSGSLWHWSALVLVLTALAGDRYSHRHRPFAQPWPGRVLLFCGWCTCTNYNLEMAQYGWHYSGSAVIALGLLGYGALFRSGTAGLLSLVSAVLATVPLLIDFHPSMALAPLCAAYVSLIVYWLCAERGGTMVLVRTPIELTPDRATALALLFTGIPALLGVLCLARISMIHDFYLTIAWTVWALVIFCWAMATRQRWFRYMGLATFGLALGRALLIDVWKLEGLYRVGAMLSLGVALLAVAYGYTRWRVSQDRSGVGEAGDGPETNE